MVCFFKGKGEGRNTKDSCRTENTARDTLDLCKHDYASADDGAGPGYVDQRLSWSADRDCMER